jgi:hypothetical protein
MLQQLKSSKTVSQKEQYSQLVQPLVKAALKTKALSHYRKWTLSWISVHGNRTELTYEKKLVAETALIAAAAYKEQQ